MARIRIKQSREGQPFIIYALVCPRTMQVRYIGQTTTTLKQRGKNHIATAFHGDMREWLDALKPEKPITIVIEEGINRIVRMKSGWQLENKGHGVMRPAVIQVSYATVRETLWQKRFRRTLFNDRPLQSKEVAALLRNPELPWQNKRATTLATATKKPAVNALHSTAYCSACGQHHALAARCIVRRA